MGSTFLNAINVVLALYCMIIFFKTLIQFGLPNHPARFTLIMVLLCTTSFFVLRALTSLSIELPFDYMKWRSLPVVAGGLGLLLQVISVIGQFSHIQLKIISRIPLMGSLLFFFFFQDYADIFLIGTILVSVLFLTVSVGKARYQKRMLLKMTLFLLLYWGFRQVSVVAELFWFPALFYFFIFEQSYGVSAMIDEYHDHSGVPV
jgi:hypothetical protein